MNGKYDETKLREIVKKLLGHQNDINNNDDMKYINSLLKDGYIKKDHPAIATGGKTTNPTTIVFNRYVFTEAGKEFIKPYRH